MGFDSFLGFSGGLTCEVIILGFFGALPPSSQPVSRYRHHHRQGNNLIQEVVRICSLYLHFRRNQAVLSTFLIRSIVAYLFYFVTTFTWLAIPTPLIGLSRLQIDWIPSAPLWFAGYLLVYNLDHLYSDPADKMNTPLRFRWSARLRPYRSFLVWRSGVMLLFWQLVTGRLWLLVPLAVALSVFHFYSRPIPSTEFRLKNLSYVKSLRAPGVIAVVLVLWPVLENGRVNRARNSNHGTGQERRAM